MYGSWCRGGKSRVTHDGEGYIFDTWVAAAEKSDFAWVLQVIQSREVIDITFDARDPVRINTWRWGE